MNRYDVVMNDVAQAEADAFYLSLSQRISLQFAKRWYESLFQEAERQLSWMPTRFPVAPDGAVFPDRTVRHVFYGKGRNSYRLLFHIIEPEQDDNDERQNGLVIILRVRHAAMRPLGQPDEEEL